MTPFCYNDKAMDKKQRRWLIINLIILIGSPIIFAFAVYELSGDISKESSDIALSRQTIIRRNEFTDKLSQFKKNQSEIQSYKSVMDALLPTKDDLLLLPGRVQDLGKSRQVTVNISFRGSATDSTQNQPGEIAFAIEASGSYQNLKDFLDEFETKTENFLASLGNFDFVKNGDSYSFSGDGKIYFR